MMWVYLCNTCAALAQLCAADMAARCRCPRGSVVAKVITFGSPRVGNHAFARYYNEVNCSNLCRQMLHLTSPDLKISGPLTGYARHVAAGQC